MNFCFDTLVKSIDGKYPSKRHPRIILTDEKYDKLKNSAHDPVVDTLIKKYIAQSEKLLEAPMPEHIIPDGIRLLATSRRVEDRIFTLCITYNLTGDERFAECAYANLFAAANFPDWNPRHFLDTAEMSAAFAFAYDQLFYWLGEERRTLLKNAIFSHGITQVLDDYENKERSRTYRWYQSTPGDNWKLVCNGGLTMAALAVLDETTAEERTICQKVLECGFESSYNVIRAVYNEQDGDYYEGLGYWEYATKFLAFHSAALASASGGDFGLSDCEALKKTPYYVIQMSSNTSLQFNFSNCGCHIMRPTEMLWFADILKKPQLASVRVSAILDGSCSPFDLLYYTPMYHAPIDALPTYFGAVGSDNATFRCGFEKNDLFCAIHFGASNIPHAHLDTGTFILEHGGERFFIDLGSDNYNLRPYKYAYRYRAEGHNTLVFNPSEAPDQESNSVCKISAFENYEDMGYAEADISDCYPEKKVVRRMTLMRNAPSVIITDKIECLPEDTVYWFAHTKAEIELSDDKKSAVLTQNGKRIFAETDGDFEFNVSPALPFSTSPIPEPAADQDGTYKYQSTNEGVRKLSIRFTEKNRYTLNVKFSPLSDAEDQ